MTEQPEALIVTDRRLGRKDVPAEATRPARMEPGEFYEINGLCYFVRKITNRDVILRRFTGTLAVPTVDATPLQIHNAKPVK